MREVEKRIQQFTALVNEYFHFLESEYNYVSQGLKRQNFQSPRDAFVEVVYRGESIAVSVVWGIGEENISVCLVELQSGKIPDKVSFYGDLGYARAINLETLIRMITDGSNPSPLPEITPGLSVAEMGRRGEARAKVIQSNLAEILEKYADRLKIFGSEILKGDTSIFPKVQEYHSLFWNWRRLPKDTGTSGGRGH